MSNGREAAVVDAYLQGGPETPELRQAVRVLRQELRRARGQRDRAWRDRKNIHARLERAVKDKRDE